MRRESEDKEGKSVKARKKDETRSNRSKIRTRRNPDEREIPIEDMERERKMKLKVIGEKRQDT